MKKKVYTQNNFLFYELLGRFIAQHHSHQTVWCLNLYLLLCEKCCALSSFSFNGENFTRISVNNCRKCSRCVCEHVIYVTLNNGFNIQSLLLLLLLLAFYFRYFLVFNFVLLRKCFFFWTLFDSLSCTRCSCLLVFLLNFLLFFLVYCVCVCVHHEEDSLR